MASRKQYKLELLLGARTAAGYKRTIKGAQNDFSSISSSAKKAAALITGAFAAVNVTGVIKDAVEVYSDYEQSLVNSAAIAGANAAEQEKMAQAARKAGRDTTKTAKESADALGYMALAGWDVNQSTKSLMPVLELSESTNADLAETSDLVTDSMSALNLKTKDLSGYLDLVVNENNSANTSASQLMKAFIKTGGAARSLGIDVQETGTALGILANNGTKAEEAGRSVSAMLTRMSSNTSALEKMEELDISIFDEKGDFVGFEDALKRINKGIAGLSSEDRAQSLKEIAGTNYYSKMIYLLEGVKKGADGAESAWDSLENKLKNSEGALDEMDAKVTDTASGALQRMQSAMDDAKISFAEAFSNEYVGILDDLASGFNTASEAITEFADEHGIEIHNAFEKLEDGAGSLIGLAGDAAGFVADNFDLIETAVAGLGTAIVTSKVSEGILGIATSIMSFSANPVTLAVAGISAGSAALKMLSTHVRLTRENMANASLERHFGNISLSVQELDEVAQEIVGKNNLAKISVMLESISDTDEAIGDMSSSLKEINKISWKLHAGFTLDKEEKQSYKTSIKEYVASAQNVIDSQGYTVSVATKLLLGNGSKIGKENDTFFMGLSNHLEFLENQLQRNIKKAVKNGVDIDTDEAIQKLLGEIDEITSGVTDAQNKAELDAIELKYSGKELSANDFKQLTKDMADYEQEITEGAAKAYKKSKALLNYRLESGNITEKQFNKEKQELEKGYYDVQAESMSNGMDFLLNSVKDTYPAVAEALEKYQTNMGDNLLSKLEEYGDVQNFGSAVDSVVLNASDASGLSADDINVLSMLLESGYGDYMLQMETLKTQAENANVEISDKFASGLTMLESMSAISGDTGAATTVLGKAINGDEILSTAYSVAEESGVYLTEGIGNEIKNNSGLVSAATKNVMEQMAEQIDLYGYSQIPVDTVGQILDKTEASGKSLFAGEKTAGTKNRAGKITAVKQKAHKHNKHKQKVTKNAIGGIYTNPILTMFAENGPEAAIPLDSSDRAKALLQNAGSMMGMYVVEDNTFYDTYDTVAYPKRDQELYAKLSGGASGSITNTTVSGDRIQITYSPQIIIQGNADEKTVQNAVSIGQAEFARMMEKYEKSKGRVSFASG